MVVSVEDVQHFVIEMLGRQQHEKDWKKQQQVVTVFLEDRMTKSFQRG